MNYEIFLKCRDLPLKPNETAVSLVIASYTGKDNTCSFPAYSTIKRQTQAGDDIIKDTIDLLRNIGILDYKNRADTLTGKKSNLYSFNFEKITFNANHLIPDNEREKLKKRIMKERKIIKTARKKRAILRRKANNKESNTLHRKGETNSQNPHVGVRNPQGFNRTSKTLSTGVNIPSTGGRSIETEETGNNYDKRSSNNISNSKSQKTVLHDEVLRAESSYMQESNKGDSNKKRKKNLSESYNEEQIAIYEEWERFSK